MKFYATICWGDIREYMPNVPYLLPASSWARGMRNGVLPTPKLPSHLTDIGADSGGFVATKIWGDYRYSHEQYVAWLRTFNPNWAATMDYCCELEVAGTEGIVRERQHRTTEMLKLFWQDYKGEKWRWLPTVQGWSVEDYVYHATQLKPILDEMRDYYGETFTVGIGTLCNRASAGMVYDVFNAVSSVLPNMKFHLWGVKLGVLKSNFDLSKIDSVDSAAWNAGFIRQRHDNRRERKAYGMTKKEHEYAVLLPRYINKVNVAINKPKQLSLF